MKSRSTRSPISRFVYLVVFSTLAVLLSAASISAQTATIYGQLSNFDVVNHSGHDGHGFEIELDGLQPNDVYYSFGSNRYGSPHIDTIPGGIRVRWESQVAGGRFVQTTLAYAGGSTFAGSCYQWNSGYDQAGCEHFGVSLTARPFATHYRWLIEDAANPGTLVPSDPPVAIPAPTYIITPPVQNGEPPVLEAQIEAPEPAESPALFGDAQWVKVFKTELNREVTLNELVTGNPIVPADPSKIEVEWELIQDEPAAAADGGTRKRKQNRGGIAFDTRSVVRRYEIYAYAGTYNPLSHEAMCADLTCTAPAEGEVGEYIGSQMAAANVAAQSVTITKTGNGTVETPDRLIRCGTDCISGYNRGQQVTLTATAARDNIFTGWAGACTGAAATCTLTVHDAMNVVANFLQTYVLQVKTSGKGGVTGNFGINCGRTCSATVGAGSQATLTAVPETGFRFANWSGSGCAGQGSTCNTAVNAATQITANFVKQ